MALEKRGNAVYHYRSRRVGKKVTRKYVASGDDARLAASVDAHRRLRKLMQKEALQAECEAWNAACAPLDALIAITDLLVKATLLCEGFHRHHQGEWRRRRGKR
jgi:hypothetical protein